MTGDEYNYLQELLSTAKVSTLGKTIVISKVNGSATELSSYIFEYFPELEDSTVSVNSKDNKLKLKRKTASSAKNWKSKIVSLKNMGEVDADGRTRSGKKPAISFDTSVTTTAGTTTGTTNSTSGKTSYAVLVVLLIAIVVVIFVIRRKKKA